MRLTRGLWHTLVLLLVRLVAVLLAAAPAVIIAQHWLSSPCSSVSLCVAPQNLQAKPDAKLAQQNLTQGLNLWQQGDYDKALLSLTRAAELGAKSAPLYLQYAQAWQRSVLNHEKPDNSLQAWTGAGCLQQIIFVTSELGSLGQATDFITRFNTDLRMHSLPICIAPKVVFVPHVLACDDVDSATRISCDIAPLAANIKELQFTHLVIFARQGKANVHNGIMYLDQQDTYDVLIHEMAHFAGFIDEYALPKALAERICSGIDSPNLVFQQVGQKQPDLHYWQESGRTTKLKLTPAHTCDNHSAQAFKATKALTFMEYHDLSRIPETYLTAWKNALQYHHNITPAYINFAQLYEQQNDDSALYWRARYQAFHQQP